MDKQQNEVNIMEDWQPKCEENEDFKLQAAPREIDIKSLRRLIALYCTYLIT